VDSNSTITEGSISASTFADIGSGSQGIDYTLNTANSVSLQITDNVFSGSSSSTGYATSVNVSNGTLCLEFTENTASPASSPSPYQFVQSGGGVFNRTTGSDSSTNTGTIDTTSGTIGAPGSCSASVSSCP
jgi:hypothetical protein